MLNEYSIHFGNERETVIAKTYRVINDNAVTFFVEDKYLRLVPYRTYFNVKKVTRITTDLHLT